MNFFDFLTMFGGLAMFLYGMEVMGDGLKSCSGDTLKRILEKLTKNTLTGVLTGMVVTAIIQASSATIVLSVGLVSAGILTLKQAVSIVLGANIGTTVTAQIIRLMDMESSSGTFLELLKPSTLAPAALVIGIVLILFLKGKGTKNVGQIFLGFGVLFTGMLTMTSAVSPLAQSQTFIDLLTKFSAMPLLEIVVGVVVTVIVQSSSAVVGMLQALSSTGTMTFSLVYPLIMGINIGTCIVTAILCSVGSSRDAKRTGVAHILFNCIGTVLFMIVMSLLQRAGFFGGLWAKVVDSGDIANFQTIFNAVTALVLLPFTNVLVTVSKKLIKPDQNELDRAEEAGMLNKNLLVSPALAMAEAGRVLTRMGALASENLACSLTQLTAYDPAVTEKINAREDRIDSFADRSDNFLINLSRHVDTDRSAAQLNLLMQSVSDFERIGDYATNIDELAQRLVESRVSLSATAQTELELLGNAVNEIVELTVDAFRRDDNEAAKRVEPLEEVIDDMVLMLRDNHTERLQQGICTVSAGLVFLEVLTYLERAADQCSRIALLMLSRENEAIRKNHHDYLRELHASGNQEYDAEIAARREQYLSKLR